MASSKKYGLDIVLSAALNGGFKGTFSSAQAEFAKLGSEIRDLNRLQSDVSSYQKQQAAVANTDAKLENLQRQYGLLRQEIGETDGSTTALEREQAKLEQRIRDTETALERQQQRLEATGSRLKEAGVDTADLAGESARLTEELEELRARQEDAAESVRAAGQAYQEAGEGAEDFGTRALEAFSAAQQALVSAGIAGALREIKDAYAECVSLAGDFEAGMSNVEALSGSTAQEMAQLSAKAKQLGADTQYTAVQSAEAMGYMAMAGWKAQDMLSGMTGVVDLARASGEDLAQVSDIVTDNLTAFGLKASDTARFADVLAAAATSANTDVGIMGETFKQSASVAGALGYSIEDVAVGVGLMANAGVKGSIAGTTLKNSFNGLLEGVTLTSAAFGEYQYSAVQADGTMKGFGSTIEELRGYFEQMTEAERVANAQAIAGEEGYNGLLAILNAADKDYQSLTESINDCAGAAKRMAEIKMDNLNGQLTLMDSAWDALRTTIGEEFNPELRRLAETGTDVLVWANGFVQAHPALVKGVMTFTGVMGSAAVAVTGVNAALTVFKALNVAALFTGPVGAILGAAAAVAAVTAAVVGFAAAADDGVPSVRELTEAARELDGTLEAAAGTYDSTASSVIAAANVADTYISKLEQMGSYARLSEAEQREYHNTLALLCQTVPELADSIDLENNAIHGGTAALRANTEAWKQNAMAQAYQEQLTALYAAQADILIEAEKNSIELTRAQTALEAAEKKRSDTLARMNDIRLAQTGAGDDPEKVRALQYEYDQLEMSLGDVENEIIQSQSAVDAYTKAIAEDEAAVASAQEEIELAEEAFRNLTGATEEQTAAETDAAAQTRELQGVLGDVTGELTVLAASYLEAYTAAEESISGQYALWDKAAEVAATSAGSINAALDSQLTYWERYNEDLDALGERSTDIAGLSDMIASFADGSKDSVNAIAGMASASDEDLRTMVSKWQELQEQQSETAGSLAELVAGFPEQVDTLVRSMEDGVTRMSLPDEAEESARSTIQAFIDKAEDMIPVVRDAYALLGQTAADALGIDLAPVSRHVNGAGNVEAFASGTDNAPPGWAWVGEEGPELIRMRGGETVLPAAVSRDFAALSAYREAAPAVAAVSSPAGGGSGAPITVELHFHVEGGAPAETVEALHSYVDSGSFEERVMDVVARASADARRGYWD